MNPEKFHSIKKLYHYTSLTTGTLILLSQKMRMSRQSKMNDINESYRTLYSSDCDIEDVYAEMNKYFQSSFTLDDGLTPGFAISPMWGHYANKGKGMCLVFDRRKLLAKFNRINRSGIYHEIVSYVKKYDSSIIVKGNPEKYFSENYKDIFFTKSDDWLYEREYRIVRRADCTSLEVDISGCIIAVIVHQFDDISRGDTPLNSQAYRSLVNQAKGLNIPVLLLCPNTLNYQLELTDNDNIRWYPEQEKDVKYNLDLNNL